jgi:hypothetical protein
MQYKFFLLADFKRKPDSALVFKINIKKTRNKKTQVYSWIAPCRKEKMRVENQTKTRFWEDSSLCPETSNAVQEFHLWKRQCNRALNFKYHIFLLKKKQFLAGILEHFSLLPQCWQCWSTGGPVTRLYLTFFPLSWGRIWPSRWNHMDSHPVHCTHMAKGLPKIASIT